MSEEQGISLADTLVGLAREATFKSQVAEREWETDNLSGATASALLAINYTLQRVALMLGVLMERGS